MVFELLSWASRFNLSSQIPARVYTPRLALCRHTWLVCSIVALISWSFFHGRLAFVSLCHVSCEHAHAVFANSYKLHFCCAVYDCDVHEKSACHSNTFFIYSDYITCYSRFSLPVYSVRCYDTIKTPFLRRWTWLDSTNFLDHFGEVVICPPWSIRRLLTFKRILVNFVQEESNN